MLLKRNLRQVSYLHVYHHASISVIWWILSYQCPNGDAPVKQQLEQEQVQPRLGLSYLVRADASPPLAEIQEADDYVVHNSNTGAPALNVPAESSHLDGSLPCAGGDASGYLTMMQMVQFVSFIAQSVYGLLFFYSLSLLLFFCNFYVQKHILASKNRKQKLSKAE
eukprot:jgi/Mesen1/1330/ME000013S00824